MSIESSSSTRVGRSLLGALRGPALAVTAGVAALASAGAFAGAAGADTTTTSAPDPAQATSAGDYGVSLIQNAFQGNLDTLWGVIDPTERSALNQNDWTSCGFQGWVQTIGSNLDSAQAGQQQQLPMKEYGNTKAQATAVTVNSHISAGSQSAPISTTFFVEQVSGAYKTLIPTADFNAFRSRSCPASLGAPRLPAAFKQADMEPGYWFETTNRFPNGGAFKVNPTFPINPWGNDPNGWEASLEYDGPQASGSEQGVMIKVLGPVQSNGVNSLASAGVWASKDFRKASKPTPTTLGGKPALAYSGVNSFGNDEWVVVAYLGGAKRGHGTYSLMLTAPHNSFSTYTKAFQTIQQSFQFWPH